VEDSAETVEMSELSAHFSHYLALAKAGRRIDLLLSDVIQLDLSVAVLESASRLPDPLLRSLDATHLATALVVRGDLQALLSYDQRLLAAAAAHGLPTAAPT
jgi:hypothetical protein